MADTCQKLNFTLTQGDTFRRLIRIKAGDTYLDLTGWTFTGQVRDRFDSTGELEANFTFVVQNPGTDGVYATLDSATTETLSGLLFYDLQGVTPDGDKITFLRGRLTVLEDVTTP